MGIQRWALTFHGGLINEQTMEEAGDGRYVLFTDHEQMFAEANSALDRACDLASGYLGRIRDMGEEVDRLRAELAAKSKDAERYRWLRQLDNAFDFRKLPRTWSAAHTPEQLDDTIDAAMGEGNGR